jgi:hypothetical protein
MGPAAAAAAAAGARARESARARGGNAANTGGNTEKTTQSRRDEAGGDGTQFTTCFTGTKVEILAQPAEAGGKRMEVLSLLLALLVQKYRRGRLRVQAAKTYADVC